MLLIPLAMLMISAMTAFLQSCFLVFLSEMGDKTQLLALVLATRFRQPWVILAGIFTATVLNHALASWAGEWAASLVAPETMRWIIASTFFLFAMWILIPDKAGEFKETSARGAFVTTVIAFFIAEMGDKTQLVTVALGAKFSSLLMVTLGTTLGMMFANGLAILFGEKLAERVPMHWVRRLASALFVFFGLAIVFY